MKVISLIGQKGGAGKSTMLRVLASAAVMNGHRVLLLDCDPNKSTFSFYEKLQQNDPTSAKVVSAVHCASTAEMEAQIVAADEIGNVDYCFIDTQGDLVSWVDDVIELSDRVVMPVKLSTTDIEIQLKTLERYTALQNALEDPSQIAPMVLVLNQIKPGVKYPTSLKEIFEDIASHPRMLQVYLQERNVYTQTDEGILLGEYAERVRAASPIGNHMPKYMADAMTEATDLLAAVEEVRVNG